MNKKTSTEYTVSRYFSDVYYYLGYGLAVCGFTALLVAGVPEYTLAVARYWYLFAIATIGISLYIQMNPYLSWNSLFALYTLFSCCEGATLSIIFWAYTQQSIAGVFMVSAVVFVGSSYYGVVTDQDLTRYALVARSILWGIVISSILGLVFRLPVPHLVMNFLIAAICPMMMASTAQDLKEIYYNVADDSLRRSIAIRGALVFLIQFINLFLSLLRIFGERKK